MSHIHEQEQSDSAKNLRPNPEIDYAGSESVRQLFVSEAQEITNKLSVNEPNSPENKDLPELFIEGMEKKSQLQLASNDDCAGSKFSACGGIPGASAAFRHQSPRERQEARAHARAIRKYLDDNGLSINSPHIPSGSYPYY